MWRQLHRKLSRDDSGSKTVVSPQGSSEDAPKTRTLSVASPLQRGADRKHSPFSRFRRQNPEPYATIADALGLQVIYEPPSEALVDIIFVHGLGGGSCKTWSKYQDPTLFWPKQWLPLEPETCQSRILTFGYNADFRYGSPNSISSIVDFAKDLLFGMKYGKDHNKEDLKIGRVPILFVVHSMGGLVVKRTYLLGQNDENYQDIVKSICGIVFLATPHRGTSLAGVLNKILSVSFKSPKNFINDLHKNSSVLEELNEQFRHVAPKLSVMSFYETLQTSVGPKSFMVLEKDSSILGYPGEISKSLNADHHDVCKFNGQADPNYASVRDGLTTLVGKLKVRGPNVLDPGTSDEIPEVEQLLGSVQNPEDDLTFFQQRRMLGTCEWVLLEPKFRQWLEPIHEPCVAWLNTPPASGKSVLASYIIEHLQDLGHIPQYFFFRFGDQTKRSISVFLRSLGTQLAKQNTKFRDALKRLSRQGVRLEKADSRIVWQRVFVSALSQITLTMPLFWVVDGLDESHSPRPFLDLLQTLSTTRVPIRILITSRNTETLSLAFQGVSSIIPVHEIEANHASSDIDLYVRQEVRYVRGSDELKIKIMARIQHSANGNFLWVHLVLKELCTCHTQQAIQQTLEEIPPGMEALYQHMDQTIANSLKQSDRSLARTLISWIICASRPLSLQELSQAVASDFPEFLDLKSTIQQVCGHFVVIDQSAHVSMVHQTARDYLTQTPNLQLSIDIEVSHEELFCKAISSVSNPEMRWKVRRDQKTIQDTEPFLVYAATSWPYHFRSAIRRSHDTLTLLVKFVKGYTILPWMALLAAFRRLDIMVEAARCLSAYVDRNRGTVAGKIQPLCSPQDLELLGSWATDLSKVVGKFGRHLQQDPTAIYKLVTPFCPTSSNMHRRSISSEPRELSVSGITNVQWDDCLASIQLPYGARAGKIVCAGHYFAVLGSAGSIFLGDSHTFDEICTLTHGEDIADMSINTRCDRLISFGMKSTKIWSIPNGEILGSTPSPAGKQAMAMTFTEDDATILTVSYDKMVRCLHVNDIESGWQCLKPGLLREIAQVNDSYMCPCYMAFSPDATQLAIAYSNSPLSVWSTAEPRLIGRCQRICEHQTGLTGHAYPSNLWSPVKQLVWNQVTGHIVGLYKVGTVFKWHPLRDEIHEAHTFEHEVSVSPDGKFFITSDSNGNIRIWDFSSFCVIYQLCTIDLVTGLAFSPECTRFYDLRGSSINVWEPFSLVRLSNAEEGNIETVSESQALASAFQASKASVGSIHHISALAATRKASLFCVANMDGVLDLFDVSKGKLQELMTSPMCSTLLTWGEDAKHIATADFGGNMTVVCLNPSHSQAVEGPFHPQTVFTAKPEVTFGGISQLILNTDMSKLFAVGWESGQTWSIETGRIESTCAIDRGARRIWSNYPLQSDSLIGVGSDDVLVLHWRDLSEVSRFRLYGNTSSIGPEETPAYTNPVLSDKRQPGSLARKALLTQDAEHLLIQISDFPNGKDVRDVILLKVSSLKQPLTSMTPDAVPISHAILSTIAVPLGVLSGGIFVFLDHDLWMCTFRLYSGDINALKRHFFIPRDWASADALEQCCLMHDGTFLLPKGGEVAMISSRLGTADW